jgi:hypothetical protein
MTQMLPSNEHIKLEKLTTASVIAFINKVYDYCTTHQVAFKLTSKVTAACRDQIISRNEGFVDEVSFNVLSNDALLRCLQRTVQPRSRDEFVMVISRFVRFNMRSSESISVKSFQVFYDALSSYKRLWLLFYDFMSADNAQNVPHCNSKENGLISLYIKPIPGDYAKNRYNTLMSRKYNNIKHFIADLWTQVQMDYERYKQYQTLTTVVGEEVPGIDHTPSRFTPKSDNEKRSSTTSPKNFDSKRTPAKPPYNRQSVNNIGSELKDKAYEEDDIEIDDNQSQYESNFGQEDNECVPDEEEFLDENDDSDFDRGDQSSSNRPVTDQLSAVANKPFKKRDSREGQRDNNKRSGDERTSIRPASKPPEKRERNGCWNILRDGICETPNCKFSHDTEDVKKSWANLDQMLRHNERKFGGQPERKSGGTAALSSD